MEKTCELCIIWEENNVIEKKPLMVDTLYNIDKFIINKKYDSSEDVRNDKDFKPIIESFLKDKKLSTRNYRGNIVIMDGNEKIKVIYKSRIELVKKLMKLLTIKMSNFFEKGNKDKESDRAFVKDFIRKHKTLFSENERICLYTGLKYNKKTLYLKNLSLWKNRNTKEKDNPNLFNNIRNIYKVLGKDMKDIIDTLSDTEILVRPNKTIENNILETEEMNTNSMDEFEEQNYFDIDEGLRVIHVDSEGKIIGNEKYSDYLNRFESIIDNDFEDEKRFK